MVVKTSNRGVHRRMFGVGILGGRDISDPTDFGMHNSASRVVFGFVAITIMLLNEVVLALWPFFPSSSFASFFSRSCNEGVASSLFLPSTEKPQWGADSTHWNVVPAPRARARSWSDISRNPFHYLGGAASLRLLPPPGRTGDIIAQDRKWLVFGLSSIRRPKADYLGITLSRIFHALGENLETALVVHLADFNEAWVSQTASWLRTGFMDEVDVGRLHVLHAPQRLYPLKQAVLAAVTLGGFKLEALNTRYTRSPLEHLHDRDTFWTADRRFFLYWCQSEGASVLHRRWSVAAAGDLQRIRAGRCTAHARAPEDHDVLDPLVLGWEEWEEAEDDAGESGAAGRWVPRAEAGVDGIDAEAGQLLKFGDSPQRQWWRSKQNLDYAFLMWYAAGMSDYYMQIEDDIQVVPHFLPTVRSYILRNLVGEQWVMASFSKLGFIGKLFNASHLPNLAEFLLVFNAEAPCDWLVWDWIDILTVEPVAIDIPDDLEKEHRQREEAKKKGPDGTNELPFMRDDVQLYYLDGNRDVFRPPATRPSKLKPELEVNGAPRTNFPRGSVRSSMESRLHYDANRAYPPGDRDGFWTSDTCWAERFTPETCIAKDGGKFVEVAFHHAVDLRQISLEMGGPDHPLNYIRSGSLQVASSRQSPSAESPQGCADYRTVASISSPNVTCCHDPSTLQGVVCVRLLLSQPQEEWICLRAIYVEVVSQSNWVISGSSAAGGAAHRGIAGGVEAPAKPVLRTARTTANDGGSSDHDEVGIGPSGDHSLVSAAIAAFVGLVAGAVGWLSVFMGRRFCLQGLQVVGAFTCWALSFVFVLDLFFIWSMTPPTPPVALHSSAFVSDIVTPCVYGAAVVSTTLELPSSPITALAPDPDWHALQAGIHRLDLDALRAAGWPTHVSSASFAKASVTPRIVKRWLAIGILLDASTKLSSVAELALQLITDGAGSIVVVLLVRHSCEHVGAARTGCANHVDMSTTLQKMLKERTNDLSLLHLLQPPAQFYPEVTVRTENIDLALLLQYAANLAGLYLQLEPDCAVMPAFTTTVRSYIDSLGVTPWIIILFTHAGLYRQIMRAELLPRFAELLVMFPQIPADFLLWDLVDIVGNQTAPKAVYIATDASNRPRPDVLLQYDHSSAIIEHLGDISSLEGKVQRHHEDYFKQHPLGDDLFDNPAGRMTTNLEGPLGMLQSLYDRSTPPHEVTCGGHSAPSCLQCPQGHGAAWCNVDCMWVNGGCVSVFKSDAVLKVQPNRAVFLELVLTTLHDIQMVSLRMGGQLTPARKCEDKHGCRAAEAPDSDFDHALDDAELQFGRGHDGWQALGGGSGSGSGDGGGSCATYETVGSAAGREVFWRSPQSRPALGVRCVRVAIRGAQQRPLVLRAFQVRSLSAGGVSGNRLHAATHVLSSSDSARAGAAASQPLILADVDRPAAASPTMMHGMLPGPRHHREQWAEQHLAWILLVSVGCVSGAFAGVLGCVATTWRPRSRRRRSV